MLPGAESLGTASSGLVMAEIQCMMWEGGKMCERRCWKQWERGCAGDVQAG